MNKFRLVEQWDEFNKFTCLKCKKNFTCSTHPIEEGWIACPICLCRWEGEFTTRHKKYPAKPHDWRNPGYKMDKNGNIIQSDQLRAVIENRRTITSKLADNFFAAIRCKPTKTDWRLYIHIATGAVIEGKSGFAWIWQKFKNLDVRSEEEYRLRIVNGDKSKVIAERPYV